MQMRVNYLDLLFSKMSLDKEAINIGWCGPFPPSKNGGAMMGAWFVKEMIKQGVNVFAIPASNVCDKALLKGVKFTKLQEGHLDAIFFYCVGNLFRESRKKVKAKTILYQTFHDEIFPDTEAIVKDMAMADMVVAPTRWSHKYFCRRGIKHSIYIPHSVDTSLFKPAEKTSQAFEVIFVSRLCFYKGIKQFLLSIPFVLKEYPDVIFRIHGIVDGSDLIIPYFDGKNQEIYNEANAVLEEILSKYKNNVKWHNRWNRWLDFADAPSIYKNADILVFPSNNEGFGLPLIEAMACGIPCIVADKPPMNEIIINNETGFCLPLGSEEHKFRFPEPTDIAEKIIFLKNNPEVCRRMSENARNRVKSEYELSKNAALLICAAKDLVGK